MMERTVFKSEMPEVSLQICLYHVLRTFSREVTTSKANINSEERTRILEHLQKMAYSKSEEAYMDTYNELKEFGGAVFRYFDTNWHPIRYEWVETYKSQTMNFGIRTNNRIESFFQKVKSLVTTRTSLQDLIEKLFILVSLQRQERSHNLIMSSMKVSTTDLAGEDEKAYMDFLTPEAYKLVKVELSKTDEVNVINDNLVQCKDVTFRIEGHACSCSFSRGHLLPCRHLLAVRKYNELSTFCPDAVNLRWTREYISQSQRATDHHDHQQIETSLATPVAKKRTVLSEHQKYKKVTAHLNLIATIFTQYDTQTFNRKLTQIEHLVSLIQQDRDFVICEVEHTTMDAEQDSSSHIVSTISVPVVDVQDSDVPTPALMEEQIDFHHGAPTTVIDDEAVGSNTLLQTSPSHILSTISAPGVDVQDSDVPTPALMEEQTDFHHGAPTTVIDDEAVGSNTLDSINLGHLTLPGKGKRCRGRPKGATKTTIGLPNKKSRQSTVPFCKKDLKTKQQLILNWYLTDEGHRNHMTGAKLSANDIETHVENIPSCVLDPTAAIANVKECFDADGWKKLQAIRRERATLPWYCKECGLDLISHHSIGCDSCLSHSHLKCLQMRIAPKSRFFYCTACKHN